jgi:hypothetical protein
LGVVRIRGGIRFNASDLWWQSPIAFRRCPAVIDSPGLLIPATIAACIHGGGGLTDGPDFGPLRLIGPILTARRVPGRLTAAVLLLAWFLAPDPRPGSVLALVPRNLSVATFPRPSASAPLLPRCCGAPRQAITGSRFCPGFGHSSRRLRAAAPRQSSPTFAAPSVPRLPRSRLHRPWLEFFAATIVAM